MTQGPFSPRPGDPPAPVPAPPGGELAPGSPAAPPGGELPPGGPLPPPGGELPPDGGNRSGLLVTAAVVVALLFLGGIVYFATHRSNSSTTAIATPSPSPSPSELSTPIPTPTPTDTPPATPAPTPVPPTAAPRPSCPSNPPPALLPGTGSYAGVDASGCGAGTAPASGAFSVPGGWDIAYAYNCSGPTGAGGMRPSITLTAHDTNTNADLGAVTGQGSSGSVVSSGSGDNAVAPAGTYVIRVAMPYPMDNQCNWHLRVYRGAGN